VVETQKKSGTKMGVKIRYRIVVSLESFDNLPENIFSAEFQVQIAGQSNHSRYNKKVKVSGFLETVF